jgi:hypothetical protein
VSLNVRRKNNMNQSCSIKSGFRCLIFFLLLLGLLCSILLFSYSAFYLKWIISNVPFKENIDLSQEGIKTFEYIQRDALRSNLELLIPTQSLGREAADDWRKINAADIHQKLKMVVKVFCGNKLLFEEITPKEKGWGWRSGYAYYVIGKTSTIQTNSFLFLRSKSESKFKVEINILDPLESDEYKTTKALLYISKWTKDLYWMRLVLISVSLFGLIFLGIAFVTYFIKDRKRQLTSNNSIQRTFFAACGGSKSR